MGDTLLFKTKTNQAFPGFTLETWKSFWAELTGPFGLTPSQICEAASYSMAMVVRFALGLSAMGGRVFAIADDTPSGWIAMATLRHLMCAGASGGIVSVKPMEQGGEQFQLQLKPLLQMGIEHASAAELMKSGQAPALIDSCHNIICGVFDPALTTPAPELNSLIDVLNEARTPIHCVMAPPGINVDSGEITGPLVFASSTLSLGAPLSGLHKAGDYAGRHYLCDLSIPGGMYSMKGPDLSPLFAEQPVIQISPVTEESNQESKI